MHLGYYHVLGTNRLGLGEKIYTPERKTAALLGYLALEGPTPRSRLAGLLWPDSGEATARNNLSQALRRLQQAVGTPLILTGDALELSGALEVDALTFRAAILAGKADAALRVSTELLGPLDYDDLPEFGEWLWGTREVLSDLRREALGAAVTNLEGRGEFAAALEYAQALLEADILSERAHAHVIRLYYLLGDRAAALRAYARCANLLKRELGVEPLPETRALLQSIEQGSLQVPPVTPKGGMPLTLLRPPQLIGRDTAWRELSAALASGRGAVLRGPAGIGKTRLLQDFAASQGEVLVFEGRPGDRNVPYATVARAFRNVVQKHQGWVREPWVRAELARILPELGNAPPIASEVEKLRFYDAQLQLLQEVARGAAPLTLIVDDLQFADAASAEALYFIFSQLWGTPNRGIGVLVAYRDDEVLPELEARFLQAVDSGQAVLLDLEPLSEAAVAALMTSLALENVQGADLARRLYPYAGGNPFFLLEALKSTVEGGALAAATPAALPPRLRELIARRVQRLSPGALRLLQAAAVLGGDFGADLIGGMLGLSSLELLEGFAELERSGFMQETHFAHDLLFEGVLAALPPTAKVLLHQRAAATLTELRADPARIAEHWLESGNREAAVPFLLRAAERSKKAYLHREALGFYQRAAGLLEAAGQQSDLFDVLAETARLLDQLGRRDDQAVLAALLSERAVTPKQEAQARHVQAEWHHALGRFKEGEEAAEAGLAAAERAGDLPLQTELLGDMVASLWFQERYEDAERRARQGLNIAETLGDLNQLGASSTNLGVILDRLSRYEEAIPQHRRAYQAFVQDDDKPLQAAALNNLLISLSLNGQPRASLAVCQQLLSLEEGKQPTRQLPGQLVSVANVEHDLGHYASALTHLARGLELADAFGDYAAGVAEILTAEVYLTLGHVDEVDGLLERALVRDNLPERFRGLAYLVRAQLLQVQGRDLTAPLATAEQLLARGERLYHRLRLQLLKATVLPLEDGVALARTTYAQALGAQLGGVALASATRAAQLALLAERLEDALGFAECIETTVAAGLYQVTDLYPPDLPNTLYLVNRAAGSSRADVFRKQAAAWIQDVEVHHVPPRYLAGFRRAHPPVESIETLARHWRPAHLFTP